MPPKFSLSSAHNTVIGDDPVRVVRGIRFAASLGLEVDPVTWQSMQKYVRACTFDRGTGGPAESFTCSK